MFTYLTLQIEAIFKSCGTRIARLSVFDREIQPNLTSYLKGDGTTITADEQIGASVNQSSRQSVYMVGTLEHWLNSIGIQKHKNAFLTNGFDRLEFLVSMFRF